MPDRAEANIGEITYRCGADHVVFGRRKPKQPARRSSSGRSFFGHSGCDAVRR